MKVMTIVGTRPEIIKLSRVIAQLDTDFEHTLVHTGQNYDYELNEVFFDELAIRSPDIFLGVAGKNVAHSVGNVISSSFDLIQERTPDAVLMLGDTNSCLAALSAKRLRVPIFHMEAGNRCFDARVPEEINRKIVDHLSDINMVYTEHARRYLLAEGLDPRTIIKTGSPMREVLNFYATQIAKSSVLERLNLRSGEFFVVSAHREENVDNETRLRQLVESLGQLVAKYDCPAVVSTHPRTQARLAALGENDSDPRIRFLKPLGFPDYITLQKNSKCVISDSGTLTEESSILGFPAVTVRHTHERPEGMDEATILMSSIGATKLLASVALAISHSENGQTEAVGDYATEDVSRKVSRIIASYTDFVMRTTWGNL